MTNLILIIASCIIIALYLISYVTCCGLPTSISDTYYNTQNKWLLPAILTSAIATAIVPFLELTPDNFRFLAFLTVAGIMFIAAAPAFKDEFEGKVHCGAAIIACISATCWLSIIAGIPWIVIFSLIIAAIDWKRKTFWLEVGLLLNLYLVLFKLAI